MTATPKIRTPYHERQGEVSGTREAGTMGAEEPAQQSCTLRWKAWREPLAHQVHESREGVATALTKGLRRYWEPPEALVQLTASPWWRDGAQYSTTLAQ